MPSSEEELRDGIAEVLAELGEDPDQLELSKIPGGASRETWLVTGGERRWVLRRDPPGAQSLASQAQEYELIRLATAGGVPVPEGLAVEPDGGRFGSAGVLMARVRGESVAPRLLSLDQAAVRLGLSRNQVRDLVAYGKLPHVALPCPRAGDGRSMRRTLIDVADLDALIVASKVRELE